MPNDSKKRRVTRACDLCRLKRAKCDGLSPSCTYCVSNNAKCTYTQAARKRGLPTGYIHDLEKKVVMLQALFSLIAKKQYFDGNSVENSVLEILELPNSGNLLNQMDQIQQNWEASAINGAMTRFILENDAEIRQRKTSANLSLENARAATDMTPSVSVSSNRTANTQALTFSTETISNPGRDTLLLAKTTIKHEEIVPTPFMGDSMQLDQRYSPSPLADFALVNLTDLSLFFRDDIFQFISDDLDPSDSRDKLVVLNYHGLPQRISGFSSSTISKYNAHTQRRNPFRVGSIFNVSSSVMAANTNLERKVPLDIFRFPSNLRKLVDNYFQIFHLWLPMLDRILIIRQVYRLQQRPSVSPDIQYCNVLALLWAILALESISTSSSANTPSEDASRYVRNAVLALENAPATTIETIQAMILLGLYFYQAGDWDNSWVLVLSATRMAMDVRLMRPASTGKEEDKKHPEWASLDSINRERTWASVYVVNTLLGARMGRSPLVRESDWAVASISEDGWEEWEAWKSFHKPDTFLSDSGRCLLTFNQLLRVVAILSSALTCTISTGSLADVVPGDSSQSRLIHDFQRQLDDWMAQLPDHCRLLPQSSPMVMYLHLCHSLTWFVVCVKLLAIHTNMDPERQKLVDIRNRLYTEACLRLSSIFSSDASMVLLHYPFMDYFVLMALNFPNMITMEAQEAALHSSRLIEILETGSRMLPPCQITWNMYRLQNGGDFEKDKTYDIPKSIEAAEMGAKDMDAQNIGMATKEEEQDLLLYFNGNQRFPAFPSFDSRPAYPSYNHRTPKEELDLFMLDTDFAKNDVRLDKFMKNLGYLGPKGGFLSHTNSNTNLWTKSGAITPNLLGTGSPSLDTLALSELLPKEKGEDL
ncbi:CIC11C00000002678 [Sungouiella intermedia]|uniref:CIC11C00000002678 n=1 Tax=Sungouiella intermedia TaxID=45354 RepID=A0A1L0BD72_9ASCO|nr:CIC11C00000002678 [[Candida] intermedia]